MDYLQEVKIRLGIKDKKQDDILESYINQAKEKILAYCYRKDIPKGLNYTLVSIAMDLYSLNSQNRKVTEEKQGNRTIKYITSCDVDNIVSSYKNELNRFKWARVM